IASALIFVAPFVQVAFMFGGVRPLALQEKRLDAGTFAITIAGRRAGQEVFEIVDIGQGRSLEVRTRTTLALPQGPTHIPGMLRADPSWKPRSGVFDPTVRGQTTRLTLQPLGDSIETVTKIPGRPTATFTRPPRVPDLYFGANMIAELTPL